MVDADAVILDELGRLAPLGGFEGADWRDVLRRASVALPVTLPRRRRVAWHRRLAIGLAALVALGVLAVAVALAAGGLRRFSAWLTGSPGKPAPAAVQSGFAHRNAAAFAQFPLGTRVRLIARASVTGKTFDLLGFRTGSSLCLRVVRADLPAGRGHNQCASLGELEQSAAPAVVLDDAWFSFGKPAVSATGIYGFADDTVKRIEVVRERSGTQSVPVTSNAFLVLIGHPSGTAANPSPQDAITGVFAVLGNGIRIRLAYIAGGGVTTQAPPPKPPFYMAFTRITPAQLPGPTKPTTRFAGGTISWLSQRKPVGEPYTLPARARHYFGTVLFARAVQPDPTQPDRIVFMIVRLAHHAFGPTTSTKPGLCFSPIEALGSLGGISCGLQQLSVSPISFTYVWPSQIAHVAGIAADQVAAIKIFLANGRVIPALLRDNAFLADVPQSVASKIVSYDRSGRVLSVAVLNSPPMHYQACPRVVAPPAGSIGPARPWERLDLGNATLNGQPILGDTPAEVMAALGKPAAILRNTVINGVRIPDFLYGGSTQRTGTVQIQFGTNHGRIVAVSMLFHTSRLSEAKLGRILTLQPGHVQRAIEKTYPGFTLSAGYGTLDAHGCLFTLNRGRLGKHVQVTLLAGPGAQRTPELVVRSGY